jgi:hypothetical protein
METTPPLPPQQPQPTPPPPQPVVILPPKRGMGCFAGGCLIIIAVLAFIVVGGGIGAWFFYGKAVAMFTSPQSTDVRIENVSDNDLQNAENKLNLLGQATGSNQETTVEFSAAELNAMIAREPLFADLNNHARVAIADSFMTVEMSVPLDQTKLPKLRGRWFNGTARFGFSFNDDEFAFELKSGEANGQALPQEFFIGFMPTFTRSFNEGFRNEVAKNDQAAIFWRHIQTIAVDGDKLVVSTKRL